jgi:AcrR family transcriptional regulator
MNKKQPLDIDELLRKICALLARHPIKDLTYSRISKLTEVPRPTLYYYFGKEIEVLHTEAMRFCMKAFIQLNELGKYQEFNSWDEYHTQRVLRTIQLSKIYPWATDVFFKLRQIPGNISEEIKQMENQYMEGFSNVWKHFHGVEMQIEEKAIRMVSYQKIGMIWGMTAEIELWYPHEDLNHPHYHALASKLSTYYTTILKGL